MTSRREFIRNAAGAAAGIAFTGCSLFEASPRSQLELKTTGRKREVLVSGRKVKVIDVHAHCIVPQALAMVGVKDTGLGPGIEDVGARRIAEMDAQGIDVEVLSINPAWYRAERDLVTKVIQMQNEKLAEFCGRYPDRFLAFASLALQYPDLAVRQLEEGMKKYGLKGAAIGGSVLGEDFSSARFHPVWAKAEELGAVLFIHPQSTPQLASRFKGNGWLSNTIGNPLDTTIALSHLIFDGTLDRFPGLKIVAAHGGGYLPSYAPRSDYPCGVNPAGCDPNVKLRKKPTEYLRSLYFDSLVFTPEALRHLAAEVGSSQIVLGTDHPIPWQDKSVDHILATSTLSDAEKVAMLGGNAARLLGIK